MPLKWPEYRVNCTSNPGFCCQQIRGSLNCRLRSTKAGKFSGAVELFYLEFARQFVENKHVKSGLGLALLRQVGEASRGSL